MNRIKKRQTQWKKIVYIKSKDSALFIVFSTSMTGATTEPRHLDSSNEMKRVGKKIHWRSYRRVKNRYKKRCRS